jgi:hypothetical protein
MMSSAERGFHKALAALRQLQKDRGFVPAKSQSTESAEPPVTEPRLEGAVELNAPSGFVPPPCPKDEEIDPTDWARAFETRHKIWNKQDAA